MNLRILTFLALAVFIFGSCKNDLKLNAPYKEFPSIYAVLNPQEKIQIIRINKVFLGEGDANEMAKVADSINYPAGELTVTLKNYSYSVLNTIVFRDSLTKADDGAFNTYQRIYVSSEKLATSGVYTLSVKNNKTGNEFTAKATSLDSVRPTGYIPLTPPYYPYNPGTSPEEYIDYSNQTLLNSIRYRPYPDNAKIFEVSMRLHFYDSVSCANCNKFNYVDYNFNNQFTKDMVTTGFSGGYILASFRGSDLFSAVGSTLSKMGLPEVIGRKMYKIQFSVYSSTQEYLDYLEYSKPSLNISQTKPLYSNFDNRAAIGIFTFRSRCSVSKNMATTFISAFSDNPYTCKYNFFTSALEKRGCP